MKSLLHHGYILFCFFLTIQLFAQESNPVFISQRYSYITDEPRVEVFVLSKQNISSLKITIFNKQQKCFDSIFTEIPAQKPVLFSFRSDFLEYGENTLHCILSFSGITKDTTLILTRLKPKLNAVKIDHLSGILLVEDLPFIPFGFYCYSPVQPGLAEEEVVRGFNMLSPYQVISDSTFGARQSYMDRCADLGMKVNYNLLTISGGGGNTRNEKLDHHLKLKLLEREILAFRDHPALLGWYISDEPDGQGVKPEQIKEFYTLIKKLDPYHPVSIVFVDAFPAKQFSDVMDIVMTDPYPIPDQPALSVIKNVHELDEMFRYRKPVWLVPQAFGGNETWKREPNDKELRAMAYLSLLNGARGFQSFIRHGLNGFPKSVIAWNELGKIAMEMAELTPQLSLSDEITEWAKTEGDFYFKAFKDTLNTVTLIAVNPFNKPVQAEIRLQGLSFDGMLEYLFENRLEKAQSDGSGLIIKTFLDGYGTRLIRFNLTETKSIPVFTNNQMVDPGFENNASTGVPSACYASVGTDRGATYFTDTRISKEGRHSLRLTTPTEYGGVTLSFFPVTVKAGVTYFYSFHAYSRMNKNILKLDINQLFGKNIVSNIISIDSGWNHYEFCFIPESGGKATINLELQSKGTVWIDNQELTENPSVILTGSVFDSLIEVKTFNKVKEESLYYSIDNGALKACPPIIKLDKTCTLSIVSKRDNRVTNKLSYPIHPGYTKPRGIALFTSYDQKYSAGGAEGLIDGRLNGFNAEPCWQGYEVNDFDALLDMGKLEHYKHAIARFGSFKNIWVYAPAEVEFSISSDNQYFETVKIVAGPNQTISAEDGVIPFAVEFDKPFRYLRVKAKNIKSLPADHPYAGMKAWLFIDEILVSER
ncbi:MAG: hypothetical protein IPH84_02835 [Bacteroidales bacterium]|nr:hypothetical protein [Bacteroidales bacterium]